MANTNTTSIACAPCHHLHAVAKPYLYRNPRIKILGSWPPPTLGIPGYAEQEPDTYEEDEIYRYYEIRRRNGGEAAFSLDRSRQRHWRLFRNWVLLFIFYFVNFNEFWTGSFGESRTNRGARFYRPGVRGVAVVILAHLKSSLVQTWQSPSQAFFIFVRSRAQCERSSE